MEKGTTYTSTLQTEDAMKLCDGLNQYKKT